jgi:hypothetical protein
LTIRDGFATLPCTKEAQMRRVAVMAVVVVIVVGGAGIAGANDLPFRASTADAAMVVQSTDDCVRTEVAVEALGSSYTGAGAPAPDVIGELLVQRRGVCAHNDRLLYSVWTGEIPIASDALHAGIDSATLRTSFDAAELLTGMPVTYDVDLTWHSQRALGDQLASVTGTIVGSDGSTITLDDSVTWGNWTDPDGYRAILLRCEGSAAQQGWVACPGKSLV